MLSRPRHSRSIPRHRREKPRCHRTKPQKRRQKQAITEYPWLHLILSFIECAGDISHVACGHENVIAVLRRGAPWHHEESGHAFLRNLQFTVARQIRIVLDVDALLAQFAEISRIDTADLDAAFVEQINAIAAQYAAEYPAKGSDDYVVTVSETDYESKYSFFSNSVATDPDYVYTDFTSDINNIVLVTYSNGTDTVQFILNYNIYEVNVNLGDGNEYTLGMYEYVRIG